MDKLQSPARQNRSFFYSFALPEEGEAVQLCWPYCSAAKEESEKTLRVPWAKQVLLTSFYFCRNTKQNKMPFCFFPFKLTVFKATEVLFWPFSFMWIFSLMLCPAFVFVQDWEKSNVRENLAPGPLVFEGSVSLLPFPMYCYPSVLIRQRC